MVVVIAASGLVTTAPTVAHADISTECATGTDTAEPQQLHRQRGRRSRRLRHDQSDRPARRPQRVDGAGRVHLGHSRRTIVVAAAADGVRPQRARSCRRATASPRLHGPVTAGEHCTVSDASYVGSELTATCSHWFWPMSGGLDQLGRLTIFYVEMVNELGSGAAPSAHPVAVWLARFDAATFDLSRSRRRRHRPATWCTARPSRSDDSFSYLFGWSYDQFNLPDPTSPPPSQMFVARVPLGRFDLQPTYWNGIGLGHQPGRRRRRSAPTSNGDSNPMQPRLIDGMWISAVKADDWNGTTVRVDVAAAPQGPWSTVQTVTVPTPHADGRTNTYARTPDAVAVGHRQPRRGVCRTTRGRWIRWRSTTRPSTSHGCSNWPRRSACRRRRCAPTTEPLGFVPTSPPIRAIDTREARGWRKARCFASRWPGLVARRCPRRGDRPRRGRPVRLRISHRVVMRRADAADIESQLSSPAPHGRHTPS